MTETGVVTRPREQRRQRTEQLIREAALRLISERGRTGWSLREVARSVNYSPAAIYDYFPSKEELLRSLAREGGRRLSDRLGAVPAGLPPRQRIVELGLACIDFALTNPVAFELIFDEHGGGSRPLEGEVPEGPAYLLLVDAVEAGLAAKALVAPPGQGRDSIAYGLWALVHGAAMLQLTRLAGRHANFTKVHRHSIETFLAGLSSPRA